MSSSRKWQMAVVRPEPCTIPRASHESTLHWHGITEFLGCHHLLPCQQYQTTDWYRNSVMLILNRTSRAEGCVLGLDLNATVMINTCPKVCGYEDMTMWLTFVNCCQCSNNTLVCCYYRHIDIPELLPQHTCMLSLLTYWHSWTAATTHMYVVTTDILTFLNCCHNTHVCCRYW